MNSVPAICKIGSHTLTHRHCMQTCGAYMQAALRCHRNALALAEPLEQSHRHLRSLLLPVDMTTGLQAQALTRVLSGDPRSFHPRRVSHSFKESRTPPRRSLRTLANNEKSQTDLINNSPSDNVGACLPTSLQGLKHARTSTARGSQNQICFHRLPCRERRAQ